MAEDKWISGGGSGGKRGGKGSGSGSSGNSSSGKSDSGSTKSDSSKGVSGKGDKKESSGSKSPTQLYKELEKKLRPLFESEWRDLDGTRPKKWFTDRYGKNTYDELLKEFLAGPHDDEWTKLDQKDDANFSEKAGHARAIAYMDSWWRELGTLYTIDEIISLSEQKHSAGKWLSQDPEILTFLTPKPT